MSRIIKEFTLTQQELCVKCGQTMPIGTPVTWLRDPIAKGYFHRRCEALPTRRDLVTVRKMTATSPFGYVWMRESATPAEVELEAKRQAGIVPQLPIMKPAEVPIQAPPRQEFPTDVTSPVSFPAQLPGPNADGILINALAQALLPKIMAQLKEIGPRMVINIYVPKKGEEVQALDLLAKELFLLESTKTI